MSKSVDLPDDVYARIEETAVASGSTVVEAIAKRFPQPAPPLAANGNGEPPRTLADMMEGLVGVIAGDGPTDLAENHSKYFGEYVEEKHRTGRL